MNSPPNFWTVFASALHLSAANRAVWAFIPWWLLLSCGAPVAIGLFFSSFLSGRVTAANAVTILAAIAVVAGFLGSVSISTATQVQRIVSQYPFSRYLRDEDLFEGFLFWPQFTLLVQMIMIIVATSSAALVGIVDLGWLNHPVIFFNVGLMIYVGSKTWNLVDLVRKLTWHYEEYSRLAAEFRGASIQPARGE